VPVTEEDWDAYGVGEKDPDTGIWSGGYRLPREVHELARGQQPAPARAAPVLGWTHLVGVWGYVVADLAALYRVDLWDPAVLARPWPGVRTLILGLLDRPDSLTYQNLRG
jgi:hypothetical protein